MNTDKAKAVLYLRVSQPLKQRLEKMAHARPDQSLNAACQVALEAAVLEWEMKMDMEAGSLACN